MDLIPLDFCGGFGYELGLYPTNFGLRVYLIVGLLLIFWFSFSTSVNSTGHLEKGV